MWTARRRRDAQPSSPRRRQDAAQRWPGLPDPAPPAQARVARAPSPAPHRYEPNAGAPPAQADHRDASRPAPPPPPTTYGPYERTANPPPKASIPEILSDRHGPLPTDKH